MKYDRNGNVVIDLSFRNLSPKQKKTIKYCLIGVLALAFVVILASTCWYTANCGPQRPLVRWPAATVRPGGQG